MKREDLEKLGLTDKAQIDAIMEAHGKDIEAHKSKVLASEAQINTLTAQVLAAGKQIEGFKALDIDGVKKAADEWKTKAEAAEQNAAKQLAEVKFNHALETALASAKVKSVKAAQALLSTDTMKDAKGEFIAERFTEQINKIKEENDFLFDTDKPAPKISTGGNNQSVIGDAVAQAAWKAAGLKSPTP